MLIIKSFKPLIMIRKKLTKLLLPLGIIILFGSWNTESVVKKNEIFMECAMDIFGQNNTPVVVDHIKFVSSLDTKTFSNIPANGGSDSGVFYWETTMGFVIEVKLKARPG